MITCSERGNKRYHREGNQYLFGVTITCEEVSLKPFDGKKSLIHISTVSTISIENIVFQTIPWTTLYREFLPKP